MSSSRSQQARWNTSKDSPFFVPGYVHEAAFTQLIQFGSYPGTGKEVIEEASSKYNSH